GGEQRAGGPWVTGAGVRLDPPGAESGTENGSVAERGGHVASAAVARAGAPGVRAVTPARMQRSAQVCAERRGDPPLLRDEIVVVRVCGPVHRRRHVGTERGPQLPLEIARGP